MLIDHLPMPQFPDNVIDFAVLEKRLLTGPVVKMDTKTGQIVADAVQNNPAGIFGKLSDFIFRTRIFKNVAFFLQELLCQFNQVVALIKSFRVVTRRLPQ